MDNKVFRAWNPKNSEMSDPFSLDIFVKLCNSEQKFHELQDHFLYTEDILEFMQFIGWEDEQGIELFENDIVKYENLEGEIVTAIIKNEGFSFELWNIANDDWELECLREFKIDKSRKLSLVKIGNTYETPQFLDKNLKFI
jgi:uncharacterized phage protein (TIGR01671 family)